MRHIYIQLEKRRICPRLIYGIDEMGHLLEKELGEEVVLILPKKVSADIRFRKQKKNFTKIFDCDSNTLI